MACDAAPRQCLEWHVKPHLLSPRTASDGFRALCPAHDDREHSLGLSIGTKQRLIWQCFAGCTRARVRAELIAAGIPSACLPFVGREKEDMLDLLRAAVTADTADHAGVRLRVLAALEGYSDLPRGHELERLAALVHVNRVTAYREKKKPPRSTHNPSSYGPDKEPVKPSRSRRRPDVA